jgi:thiamine biosynthesis lipoprotein
MAEVARLDQLMSHYNADSGLSRLVREARRGTAVVEPDLFQVIQTALTFSRSSGGAFDITIAPLLKAWKQAYAAGRPASAAELTRAAACVGFEQIETRPPDRIRFTSDCVELDLGGIGKGYAVDRALAVLRAAGIRHALVSAGGSSIGAIGAPPGRAGWPVSIGTPAGRMLMLRDRTLSTSQQNHAAPPLEESAPGEIIDPHRRAPIRNAGIVTVVGPSAAEADAMSTTLLLLSIEHGKALLARFPGTSAVWLAPSGAPERMYGPPLW